jgi:CIC family chloride channel protein
MARMNLLAITVGVIAGLGAALFRAAIWLFQGVFWGGRLNPGAVGFSPLPTSGLFGWLAPLGSFRFVLLPALGGLLVGIVIALTTREVSGHGVPKVLEAILTRSGRIRPSIALYKTLASSIAIGSGQSLGREGPIVQIGSAAGSWFGRFSDVRSYRRTLVAAGAAGGIAATFNAPLAGIMFALEIILSEFDLTNAVAVVLSSVTATAVARPILSFTEDDAFLGIVTHKDILEAFRADVVGVGADASRE